ncbi:MAG TPA: hypothetical protein VJT82_05105 [Pyrinomonadaceae bacterium]|nr:hypothetical protein [Pyrinomonadaceae bacterium]
MRNISLDKLPSALLLIAVFCGVNVVGQSKRPPAEPQKVTLFSRITYKESDYGKSAFNFRHGLRSDDERWMQVARNSAQLMYGSIFFDTAGSDWFSVSMGGDDPSRIKDLGELQWSEVYYTPVLFANPRQSEGVKFPAPQESFEESSDERVTKVVAGHMYLVHIKNREADVYAMFRVETLVPSDRCTISWKVMPSPEK